MASDVDRRELLDAASAIVAHEGISALSVRRVAKEVGASTMVVYTHFGDKSGLVEAVAAEGFRRFAATLAEVHRDDPFEHLMETGRAYRRYAQANPSYYRLLFSRVRPPDGGFAEAKRHGEVAYAILLEGVTRVLARLDRPAREVEAAAVQVWSTVHGFVSLELSHELPPDRADALYEATLAFVLRGLGKRD
ncbi:MAG: TetR/AcrR family transcriptional regulator [Myxococcota bacterium]